MPTVIRAAVIAASFAMLAGCVEARLSARYVHHSSIPTTRDLYTTDAAGACLEMTLGTSCGDYCPELAGCAMVGDAPYGPDPIGHVTITQPLKVWR